VDDTEEHINFLETQIELLGNLGLQNYWQNQMGEHLLRERLAHRDSTCFYVILDELVTGGPTSRESQLAERPDRYVSTICR
jgi:hypothetical protein